MNKIKLAIYTPFYTSNFIAVLSDQKIVSLIIHPHKDNNEIVAGKLTVYPGDHEEYFTFITSQAYTALEDWMKFRSEYGEKVTGESWLMRDIWQTSNMKYGA